MINDTDTASSLVNAGADPNTRFALLPAPSLKRLHKQHLRHAPPPDNDSPTALMFACEHSWNSSYDKTALPLPVEESVFLLQTMLAHGANVHARGDTHRTALHYTVFAGRWQTAELLIQHGADVNAQDEVGYTPLMLTVINHTTDVARVLLAHGANPNIQDMFGSTALHWAVPSRVAEEIIPELLANRADLSLPDKHGKTPLQYAQDCRRPDLVELMRRGAK